jgi:hypothetical protein
MTRDNDKKAAEEYLKLITNTDGWFIPERVERDFLAGCEHKQKELDKATELLSLVHVCLREGRFETLFKAFNIPTPLVPPTYVFYSEEESEKLLAKLNKEQEL